MSRVPRQVACAGLPALLYARSLHGRSLATVIWLHGIGERGCNPTLVAKYGLPAALNEGRAVANCDVICPQLPPDEDWEPGRVHSLVCHARRSYGTVILVGFSLGGLGVLDFVAQYGAGCNLAIAIAAECHRSPVADQSGVVLLSIQGEHDYRHSVSAFVASVRQLGGAAEEVVVAGGNHFISESALWQPQLLASLAAHGVKLQKHEA